MFHIPNYTSSPIIKQNYTSQAGLRLKNLSHLLSERYCQTPNALSNRVDYSAGNIYAYNQVIGLQKQGTLHQQNLVQVRHWNPINDTIVT